MKPNTNRPVIGVVLDPWHHPFNGTVVSTRRVVDALQNRFRFKIFLTGSSDVEDQGIEAVAFPQLSVPGINGIINSMQAPLGLPNKQRLIQELATCDLIHIQYPFFLAKRAISIARELKLPIVSSFHVQPENIQRNLSLNQTVITHWLYRLFIRHYYQASDQVIAPSSFARDLLTQHGLTQPVEVLSNGVTSKFFRIQHHNSPSHEKHLLCVGRLAPEKQQTILLKALANSKYKHRLKLTLAGTGPQETALKKLARDLRIPANIGRVDDMALAELYAKADLFVQCSSVELEGMSAMEAMAAGCPTLLNRSKTSALTELILDEAGGFDAHRPGELTRKVDNLLEDSALNQQLVQTNRHFIESRHHDHSVEQLANLYHRILSENGFSHNPQAPSVT